MKKITFIPFFLFLFQVIIAQTGGDVFTFLRFPQSSRVNALGGNNISLVERDPSLTFQNPALLGAEMDGMINLNYMNYISDINVGSALYTKARGENGAWGFGASYINYGKFKQTTSENNIEGDFSVNDISLNALYSHNLSERWRGGLALKFLYSSIEQYSSIGVAVDAGLSYYNSETEFSTGIVLKNIGAQIKPYNDERQKLPWDIQLGVSKKMEHAPFRFSLTAMYLNKWNLEYRDDTNKDYTGDSFVKTLTKHFVIGIDYLPSDNFWLGVGFNPKVNSDMKLQQGNGLGGFSIGGGVKIKAFDVGVSLAQHHPSASSLMLSVSASLLDLKP